MHYFQDTNPEVSTNAQVIFRLDHFLKLKTGSYLSNNKAVLFLGIHDWSQVVLDQSLQYPKYLLTPRRCWCWGMITPVTASWYTGFGHEAGWRDFHTPLHCLCRCAGTTVNWISGPNMGLKVTLDLTSKHGPACWSDVMCGTDKGWWSRGTGTNSRSNGAPIWICQENSHVTKHHLHHLQREHKGSLKCSSESTGVTWMGMSQGMCWTHAMWPEKRYCTLSHLLLTVMY